MSLNDLILSVYVALLVVWPDGPGTSFISRQSPERTNFRGGRGVAGVKLRALHRADRTHSKQPQRAGECLEG